MSDPWVLNTQKWLNSTYGSNTGFNKVTEDGQTGFPTVYALTRALQIELGVSPTSDTFGPGTFAALTRRGSIGASYSPQPSNLIRIIQGAMYCKGYNGGNGALDGTWSATTTSGTKSLRADMGVGSGDGSISPKIFKALLTMDAYVLLQGGSNTVQAFQRSLNARYLNRSDFYISPADGLFSRAIQTNLIFAVQYELGFADGTANGTFGPQTQSSLKSSGLVQQGAADTTKYFVHLFQGALNCNGYNVAFDGTFSSSVAAQAKAFQLFSALSPTGAGDFPTWASLLISYGDTSRAAGAADSITTITSDRAKALKSSGFSIVGRYLTNTPVTNPTDKNLKPGELSTIFAAGLKVVPIFQEGDTDATYFSYGLGYTAGQRADNAARGYGFKDATTIYFAVDWDAEQDEVDLYVVPYFRGVRDGLGAVASTYSVGIYSARNTCARVYSAGLATSSFVSDMSSGYSGNLGFALPGNWAFDQILEYTIGSGTGQIDIDKDVVSGRDPGQGSIGTPTASSGTNADLLRFLYWLESQAEQYHASHSGLAPVEQLVASYMRAATYTGVQWDVLAGSRADDWVNYVESNASAQGIVIRGLYRINELSTTADLKADHFFATLSAYLYRGVVLPVAGPAFVDIGGWAGDVITTLADFENVGKPGETANAFATRVIGQPSLTGQPVLSFSDLDLVQDVDGFNVAALFLAGNNGSIPDLVKKLLSGGLVANENRYQTFLRLRFGGSTANLKSAGEMVFTQPANTADQTLFNSARTYLLQNYHPQGYKSVDTSTTPQADPLGTGDGFADVLSKKAAKS